MLNPFANRKLLKRGERAQARIVEMTSPEHGAEPSNVDMTLEISFRGVPYEVTDRWMVSGTEPISPGSEIWVAVDPEKRHRVAIDWDRTRADYRERTDVRRRVLSGGVPVPLTKLRDALEQANGGPPKPAVEKEVEAGAGAVEEIGPSGPPDGMSRHERELLSASPMPVPKPSPPKRRTADDEDLTSKLERLATLNAAGALTDGEFTAAKAHVLAGQ